MTAIAEEYLTQNLRLSLEGEATLASLYRVQLAWRVDQLLQPVGSIAQLAALRV